MTKYANDSSAQNVFLNLKFHFTCILEFPHPAVWLYLPVAIQTRWIKGLCRDRICLAEKTRISQKRILGICSNIPWMRWLRQWYLSTLTSTNFCWEKACLLGKNQTPVNWQNLAARSSHAIVQPKERWSSSLPSMARNGRTETVEGASRRNE